MLNKIIVSCLFVLLTYFGTRKKYSFCLPFIFRCWSEMNEFFSSLCSIVCLIKKKNNTLACDEMAKSTLTKIHIWIQYNRSILHNPLCERQSCASNKQFLNDTNSKTFNCFDIVVRLIQTIIIYYYLFFFFVGMAARQSNREKEEKRWRGNEIAKNILSPFICWVHCTY